MKSGIAAWQLGKTNLRMFWPLLLATILLVGTTGCSVGQPAAVKSQVQADGQPASPQGQNNDQAQTTQKQQVIQQGVLASKQQTTKQEDTKQWETKTQDTADKSIVPKVSAKFFTSIPVLYYHSVMLEPGNELRMPPEEFAGQMAYLFEHGYHTISPEELEQFLSGKGELPNRPFVITFDDGYADNYLNALPILQKYKFTATVFMVSGYIDGKGFLSLAQLRELVAAGWTIGGHTVSHADLTKADPDLLKAELLDSKALLEKDLGKPVRCFAYPFGVYNSEVEKMLQEAGYTLAFTTERGWALQGADPLLVHRIYCFADMGMKEFERRITEPGY